ncbi:hypothetical protein [Bacillus chungangensis]|uniref:Damage-inducible protein DinB n=1 Tax=Bacillus chungangensis TaxID=587633 RepID=A0ABT9WTB0_9BACI|nr:hypothetical protein [Bacillus chungangensis]MDQ0176444.1 putative damage-inducible protein DinB [Bacillus chungangensis]
MNEQETLMLFVKISQQRMHRHYLPKLIQSIQVIHTDVLWDEQSENLNSIGGIILHICEHIKRSSTRFSNLLHTEYGEGIEAYFPNENLSPNELCLVVNETFTEFYSVMDNLLARMPEQIDMHRLFHLVEHTSYHLGQVIDRSKRITKISFKFCQNGINEHNLKLMIKDGDS